jgi:hypothetical protein
MLSHLEIIHLEQVISDDKDVCIIDAKYLNSSQIINQQYTF